MRQLRATEECLVLDDLDGRGYRDASEMYASLEIPLSNLLQSIAKIHISQLLATAECLILNRLMDGWTLT